MADTGDDVKEAIGAPFKAVSDFMDKVSGSAKKMTGGDKDVMKSIPDDNANKSAWENATKYTKPTPLAERKTLGSKNTATTRRFTTKQTARKR